MDKRLLLPFYNTINDVGKKLLPYVFFLLAHSQARRSTDPQIIFIMI